MHALALQPENLEVEFSVEPEIPEGAFTTTATLREFIEAFNASLPALLSADEIKALLEEHNASLPVQVPLGASPKKRLKVIWLSLLSISVLKKARSRQQRQ